MLSFFVVVSWIASSSVSAAEPCLIAGWRGTKTASGCYAKEFAESAEKCPQIAMRSAPCNPQWFGAPSGTPVCAEKRSDQRWTISCLQKAAEGSRERLLTKLDREFSRVESEIERRKRALADPPKPDPAKDSLADERLAIAADFDSLCTTETHLYRTRADLEKRERSLRRRATEENRTAVFAAKRDLEHHERLQEKTRARILDRIFGEGKGSPREREEWMQRLRDRTISYEGDSPEAARRNQAERAKMAAPFLGEFMARNAHRVRTSADYARDAKEMETKYREALRMREEIDYWRNQLAKADLSIEAILAGGATIEKIREHHLGELREQGRFPENEWSTLAKTCEDVRNARDRKDCAQIVKFLGGGELRFIPDLPLAECRPVATEAAQPTPPKVVEDFVEADAYEIRDLIQE